MYSNWLIDLCFIIVIVTVVPIRKLKKNLMYLYILYEQLKKKYPLQIQTHVKQVSSYLLQKKEIFLKINTSLSIISFFVGIIFSEINQNNQYWQIWWKNISLVLKKAYIPDIAVDNHIGKLIFLKITSFNICSFVFW